MIDVAVIDNAAAAEAALPYSDSLLTGDRAGPKGFQFVVTDDTHLPVSIENMELVLGLVVLDGLITDLQHVVHQRIDGHARHIPRQ